MTIRSIKLLGLVFLLIGVFSCQKDEYTEPTSPTIDYTKRIVGKLEFRFQQKEDKLNYNTYINTLTVKNISTETNTSRVSILSFNSAIKSYSNTSLSFTQEVNLSANDSISYTLNSTQSLFSDENTLISLVTFGDNGHGLRGLYEGEVNLYQLTTEQDGNGDDVIVETYQKTLLSKGLIDYEGRFHFFTKNDDETDIKYGTGIFNSINLFNGMIYNDSGQSYTDNLSHLEDETSLTLAESNLTGDLNYSVEVPSEDSDMMIIENYRLKFNLNKTN